MSAETVIATVVNLEGRIIQLLQIGRSYLVASSAPKECPHDKGWTAEKVEPDLYAWVCNCGCGTQSASHPDDPTAVRYVRHVPGPEDKVIKLAKGVT